MNPDRYFDAASTSPLDPRVLDAMLPYLRDQFGNANSLHGYGRAAHDAVEKAREQVATLIGAEDPSQIFFTSGATEANNWVAKGFRGILSPYEHSSFLNPAEQEGWTIWDPDLTDSPDEFEIASVMTVNNETGQIFDIRNHAPLGMLLHADATQAVGKTPFSIEGLSFASMSAHKLHGPKGVGALFCAEQPPTPFLIGGEQELGFRGGTSNVPGIVGFGAAAEIALEERQSNFAHAAELRSLLLHKISHVSDHQVLGGDKTSPFILSLSFEGVEGETLVVEADGSGFAISSGAACSSRSTEPSHVLVAMGLESSTIRGTVRISFHRGNTVESTTRLASSLAQSVEKLRTLTKGRSTSRNAMRSIARH